MLSVSCRRWRIVLLLWFVFSGAGSLDILSASWVREAQTSAAGVQVQTLSPAAQAYLRSLIEAGTLPELRWPDFQAYREDVKRFYELYGYALPWVRSMQPSAQARAVIAVLQQADETGLSAEDYDGPRWLARLAKLKPLSREPEESEAVRFDLALTVSLMRYISDSHTGRIDPYRFGIEVSIAERKYNLPQFLQEEIVHAANVPVILRQVQPLYPGYQRTIEVLQKYQRLAAEETGQPFPSNRKTIAPGQTYAAVPHLARFLRLVGDLPADASIPEDDKVYQGALVKAVKRFQDRHGLTPDGRIDAHTLEELNIPMDRRVRQIQLTLERWRWLPAEYGEASIVVNIPEFQLRAYYNDFRIASTMKVVVGKAYDHMTPIFMSDLRSVIFRPYWEVPLSIARAEIIPAIERDSRYLKKENMELVDGRGNVVATDTITASLLDQVRTGKLSVRQRPGPNNALGLIKFEFPNEYSIYMHDTPAQILFSRSKRDFSHGCIRLEKPAQLAAWVLRDNPGWDIENIRAAMNGDKTREVRLAHSIPVLIVYGTVVVLQDGAARFYDDLYGQDAELDRALQKDYPYPH